MVRTRLKITFLALTVMLMTVAASAGAEDVTARRLATERVSGSGISWQLAGFHDEVVLRVKGPRYSKIETVRGGANPSFQAFDEDGAPLADGIYNFELRVIHQPPADLVEAVEQARDNGDAEAYGRLSTELQNWGRDLEPIIQSGAFRMTGGALEMFYDSDREVAE